MRLCAARWLYRWNISRTGNRPVNVGVQEQVRYNSGSWRLGVLPNALPGCCRSPHSSGSGKWRIDSPLGARTRDVKLGSANQQSSEAKELVVFDILRESKCADCGAELLGGDFLFMEDQRPLCLTCADLDHLVYLPRGDTALTRRARKHSKLSAVVVRFSRARKRYERQGVLVEESALEQAEAECSADVEQRRVRRERAEIYRDKQDQVLAMRMVESIRRVFPGCPPEEAQTIAAHTSLRGSGRVGRTASGRALEEEALRAAVVAAIRHRHTKYDHLLMRGIGRMDARDAVRDDIDRMLECWRRTPG
jgi:hypothetical protein